MVTGRFVAAVFLVAALGASACSIDDEVTMQAEATSLTTRAELRGAMRRAWIDQVRWRRFVLVSTVAELPDAHHAAARLARSEEAIADVFTRVQGGALGDDLAHLLRDRAVADLAAIDAAQRGDEEALSRATAASLENAREIADRLAASSPRLPRTELEERLRRQVEVSLEEAQARLRGDWDADVVASDRLVDDVVDLADTLIDALAGARGPGTFAEETPEEALRLALRARWTEQVTWMRHVLVAHLEDLPDAGAATTRLLRGQAELADAMRPALGDDVADELTRLLQEHALLGLQAVLEARAPVEVQGTLALAGASARDRWLLNADAIAALLTSTDARWDEAAVRGMLRVHVDQTLAQVTARLEADWEADLEAHDAVLAHALRMADVLADGLSAPPGR